MAIGIFLISAGMQENIRQQQRELATASSVVNNAVAHVVTVKCFNTQEREGQAYVRAIRRAANFYSRQARINGVRMGYATAIMTAMIVAGFYYGGHLVHSGATTSGKVITTFLAALAAIQSFTSFLPHLVVLEKGRAAGVALKGVLDAVEKGRKVVRRLGVTPRFCEGEVEVRGVSAHCTCLSCRT